jgi:hypothetical protein
VQESGETLFVPSNWFHQVHNDVDTLSVNQNWCNGYNIHFMWTHLQSQLQECKDAIRHLVDEEAIMTEEEWHHQSLVLFRAQTGIGLDEFISFLSAVKDEYLPLNGGDPLYYTSDAVDARIETILSEANALLNKH